MVRKRWELNKGQATRKALALELSEELGLPPFAAMLALGRGVEPEDIPGFLGLDDQESMLTNPYALPDMELAVERIEYALEQGEHITVFGDYDCDGVTSTAVLYQYLRGKAEADAVSYYLPDRHKEGYGLNMAAVDALAARGTTLIVTVDNGVSAVREIAHAKALGMDVVVTDHHQIGNALPDAAANVNPHRQEFELEFRDFTGVGVAFLLVCALEGTEPEELLPEYAVLVALGTVADVAPLRGDNRVFVREGLAQLQKNPGVGLAALLRIARSRSFGTSTFSFCLAPRVNAAGRMGLAEEALALLLVSDEAEAERLAQRLELYNEERQNTEREIMAQATAYIEEHPERRHDRVLVFAGEGWHDGVIGIVASRLLERFGKPVLMITIAGENAKGSGRSIPGFHLFEAVHNSAHLMQKYGGHELAAGFSLPACDVERFREEINEFAARMDEMPYPLQALDMKLGAGSLSPALADEIALLEPFGQGNQQPVFALRALTLIAVTPLSGGKHLRLTLEQAGARVNAMAFHTSREEFGFAAGDVLDIAVTLEANDYMGKRGITLIVRNAKFSALPNEALLCAHRLVEQVLRREELVPEYGEALLPSRDDAALIFRAIKARPGPPMPPERLLLLLNATDAEEMARIWLAAEALCELKILETDARGGYMLAENLPKSVFEEAEIIKFLANN